MKKSQSPGPFLEVATRLYIHLPPCFATKPVEGIQEQLNGFLMRYLPQVEGVVLAHSDLKVEQPSGRIMYDSPYCHFWITVKLLVWKPVKGSTLTGTINLQSPDHIGLLLYGTFNASILSEHIPKDKYEFNPNSTYTRPAGATSTTAADGSSLSTSSSSSDLLENLSGEWVVKATGESIGHEGVIEFEVSDLVRANDMLTVTGSLMNVPVTVRRQSMMVVPGQSSTSKSGTATTTTTSATTGGVSREKRGAVDETEEQDASSAKRIKKEKKKEKKEKESGAGAATEASTSASTEEKPKKEKKQKKEKKDKSA